MRRRAAIVITLIVAGYASPSSGQLFGLRVGASESEARDAFGRSAKAVTRGRRGGGLLMSDDRHATLCNGRVVSVQETFGRDLDAFAATVQTETLRRGTPRWRVNNARVTGGEISTVEASWQAGQIKYRVAIWSYQGRPPQVFHEYSIPDQCE